MISADRRVRSLKMKWNESTGIIRALSGRPSGRRDKSLLTLCDA